MRVRAGLVGKVSRVNRRDAPASAKLNGRKVLVTFKRFRSLLFHKRYGRVRKRAPPTLPITRTSGVFIGFPRHLMRTDRSVPWLNDVGELMICRRHAAVFPDSPLLAFESGVSNVIKRIEGGFAIAVGALSQLRRPVW